MERFYKNHPRRGAKRVKLSDEELTRNISEQKRAYYQKNRDRLITRSKQRYREKKEEISAYHAGWRKKNFHRKSQSDKNWRARNLPKTTAYSNERRARKLRAQPHWLNSFQLAQIQEFYEIAAAMSCQTGIKHHVDHIVPLKNKVVSGLHVPWNLQVIPARENLSKNNRLGEDIR